jgi:hypothetical protein
VARPTTEQLRYVVTEAAQQAIEELAGDQKALRALAHDWFPEADEFDLRWAAEGIATGLTAMRGLLEARRLRMIEDGRTVMPT